MDHPEIVALIRDSVPVPAPGQSVVWGDFGAGWGNFTRALRELIGVNGVIYAVDRDQDAFRYLRDAHGSAGTLHTLTADFTQPLDLPPLDGILMANALHFVRDQLQTLKQIASYVRPGGRLILVEYDMQLPRPWVPHPITQHRFPDLMIAAGLQSPRIMATRVSPSSGVTMYAGIALKASPG